MSIVTYLNFICKYNFKEMREFCNFFAIFFQKNAPPRFAEVHFYVFRFGIPKARRKIGASNAGGFINTIFM